MLAKEVEYEVSWRLSVATDEVASFIPIPGGPGTVSYTHLTLPTKA